MADPVIEDIKSRLDIVDIIGSYITLKRSGTNFKGLCPFHNEKSPSFMVNRERQQFRCFGCGESGDVFAFIMKQENVDFANALQLLAGRAGVELPERRPIKRAPGEVDKPILHEVSGVAAKFFHHILTQHAQGKAALAYVQQRGVSAELIETFAIGFAPENNSAITTLLQRKGFPQGAWRQAGSPERFRDRVMFPFRDVIGNVVGFSGRAMGDAMPKYLNTSETAIFKKNRYIYGLYEAKKAIAEAERVCLVEGQLDVVMAHQAGTRYTVATSGTALTDEHLRILRRYADTLILAFDGDSAGRKATERAIQLALPHGFVLKVVHLNDGQDPGDLAAQDPQAWQRSVSDAVSAIEWLFRYHFPEAKSSSTASERERIYNALFPYIDQLDDSVARAYALQRLAISMGVTQDKVLVEAFEAWKAKPKDSKRRAGSDAPVPVTKPEEKVEDEQTRRERNLVAILLLHPELLAYRNLAIQTNDIVHSGLRKLYTQIISWYNESTTKSSSDLLRVVEATLSDTAKQSLQKLLFDTQTSLGELSEEQRVQEYAVLTQALRQRRRDARIQDFATTIAAAEAANDRARVLELMKEMQTVLKEADAKENS